MKIELEDGTFHEPKDSDEVVCEIHNVVTTYGALDPIAKLALECGIDVEGDVCIFSESGFQD